MNKQQITDKIQKLLALANSSNEHEAQAAAKMAQQLLTKYNLTMTEVQKEEIDYTSELVETDRQRQNPAWKYVQSIVREFFFVEIVQSKRSGVGIIGGDLRFKSFHIYMVFGKSHNVEIAKFVIEFLMRSFQDLFDDYRKRTGAGLSSRNSYYLGLFKGLHEQLKAIRKDVETETGLVVVEDVGLQDFVKDSLSGKIKSVPSKHVINTDSKALNEGYEKGKTMSIARGLGSSKSKESVSQVLKIAGKA